jgi:ankyrin repeat protein
MDNHSLMTPLHHAVLGGHGELVKELVKSGSDVNALNREGKSAIRMAAEKGFYR